MSSHLHAIVAQQHAADLLRRSEQHRQRTGYPVLRTRRPRSRTAGASRVGVRRRRVASATR